jgi:hypothetical protein
METTILSYAVQAFRADGTKGVCSTFGDPEVARGEALRLVAECGYARCEVETWEGCAACKGAGRRPKKRGKKVVPYAWIECEACEGKGMWAKGVPVDPANELVTYEDKGERYEPTKEDMS